MFKKLYKIDLLPSLFINNNYMGTYNICKNLEIFKPIFDYQKLMFLCQ